MISYFETPLELMKFRYGTNAPKHFVILNEYVMRLISGDITKLAVSLPPRHGVSSFFSRVVPEWYLGHNQRKHVGLYNYNPDVAEFHVAEINKTLESLGSSAVSPYQLWGVGVGSSPAGRFADLTIVDSPIKNTQIACSSTERELLNDWFYSTVLTRRHYVDSPVLVVGPRWHAKDLIGSLKSKSNIDRDSWTFVDMSAIAENDEDWVMTSRKMGEPLWPERYSIEELHEISERMHQGYNGYWWKSLYQQNPPDMPKELELS